MNVRDLHDDMHAGDEPPSADVLAGEYVVGVLDAAQRREVEARIETDAGFARLVEGWQQRLAPWLDAYGVADVPAHLWPRIRSDLGWSPVEGARRPGVWHNVAVWRAAAGLAAVVAIAALLADRDTVDGRDEAPTPVVVAPAPTSAPEPVDTPPAAPLPVTTLAHDDGTPGWLASVDRDHGKVLMVPVPTAGDAEGRVAELWVIADGAAPASLGIVSNDHSHTVEVPDALRAALVDGSLLAVTLEPQGGAPGGVPTGPIIAKGDIRQL
jgi:anti-sigma-K factor RskA